MRGPEFHQTNKGNEVATEPNTERWSEEEVLDGESILAYIKKHIDTDVVAGKYAQVSMAARALGLLAKDQTFRHLTPGLKSFLEYVWWLDTPEGRKKTLMNRLPTVDEWLAEVDPRTLHPEDESDHIKYLDDIEKDGRR